LKELLEDPCLLAIADLSWGIRIRRYFVYHFSENYGYYFGNPTVGKRIIDPSISNSCL
jgi:hypothetical protein